MIETTDTPQLFFTVLWSGIAVFWVVLIVAVASWRWWHGRRPRVLCGCLSVNDCGQYLGFSTRPLRRGECDDVALRFQHNCLGGWLRFDSHVVGVWVLESASINDGQNVLIGSPLVTAAPPLCFQFYAGDRLALRLRRIK